MLFLKKLINDLLDKNKLPYLTFIFILVSINIGPHYFFNFNLISPENEKKTIDLNLTINIIRFIAPIILTVFLLIKNKNKIKIIFFKNNFINIYMFYFIICIISALINFKNIKSNILELYFIVIIPVLIFFIIVTNLNIKEKKIIYLLAILFISFVTLLFVAPNFYDLNYFTNLRNSPIYNPDLHILGVNTIKSTGISRLLLIIYIFLFVKILCKSNYKYKILIILSLLNILIFLFESRTSFYFLELINCLIFFSKNFKKFFTKLIIFLIFCSIGYFSVYLAKNFISFNNFEKENSRYILLFDNKHKSTTEYPELHSKEQKNILLISKKTSGRTDVWIKLFEKEKSPLILGHGIERDKNIFGLTISNGALYSYISGGILGLLSYFFLIFLTIKNILFFLKKHIKDMLNISNFYEIVSIIVLIFLILRSLVETSFMFFGIDMIFFIISNILISQKIQK